LTTIVFPFFGVFNGFFAARMYTFFNGSAWEELAGLASITMPVVIGVILFIIELLERLESEMFYLEDLPFTEPAALILYWCLVSVPCTFCGVYFACSLE